MLTMQDSNTFQTRKRIALGMSGGVDSSLAAHLLVEQGFDVTGVFLECWRAPGCRSEEDRADALKVALSLNIPFRVLDFKSAYKQKVVEYFFDEYQAGRTPNPDVLCNKEIKFGLFLDWALDEGFDAIATGHYAQVLPSTANHPAQLTIPKDTRKDQTYFLYLLTQNQLDKCHFPLAQMTKQEVRTAAQQRAIHVSNKKDSVGICFIGDINVHDFLKDRLGENPGDVIDIHGRKIGTHKGLWFYTIGQRHGFSVDSSIKDLLPSGEIVNKHLIPPFYVLAKRATTNQLVVGFGSETFVQAFYVHSLHWIQPPDMTLPLKVRIRHTGALLACHVHTSDMVSHVEVELSQPAQGIAPGQSAVFYQQAPQSEAMICLGGGIITAPEESLAQSSKS